MSKQTTQLLYIIGGAALLYFLYKQASANSANADMGGQDFGVNAQNPAANQTPAGWN